MERRKFTRVPLDLKASVAGESGETEGEVKDLSLHGAFVKLSSGEYQPGEDVEIALRIVDAETLPPMWCKATVVRADPEGVALEFGEMAPETFGQLKNLVAYTTGDADKITAELSHFLRGKPTNP